MSSSTQAAALDPGAEDDAASHLLMPDLLWCMVPFFDGQQMLALLLSCKEAASVWRSNDALQVRWLLCEQKKQDSWAECSDRVAAAAERLHLLREQLTVCSQGMVSWTFNARLKSLVAEQEQLLQQEVHSAEAAGMTSRQGAGRSSIARVLRSRRPELFKALLQQEMLDQGRPAGETAGLTEQHQRRLTRALVEMAAAGSTEFVELLLAVKPSVNKPLSNGRTALAAAALGGHTDCVRLLLQDFDSQPLVGKMALRAAACSSCSQGCHDKACLGDLMKHEPQGIAFRCAMDTPGAGGELIQALLEAQAQGGGAAADLGLAAAAGSLAATAGRRIEAAIGGNGAPNAACVAALLTVHDVDPNLPNLLVLRTPLISAARWGLSSCVATLLAHPRIDVNRGDCDGCTALWEATRWGWSDVVERLLAVPDIKLAIRLHVVPLLRVGPLAFKLPADVRDAAVSLPFMAGISCCLLREQAQCIRLVQRAQRLLPADSLEQQVGSFWWRVFLLPSQCFISIFVATVEASDFAASAAVAAAEHRGLLPSLHRRRITTYLTNAFLIATTFGLVLVAELAWCYYSEAAAAKGLRLTDVAFTAHEILVAGPTGFIYLHAAKWMLYPVFALCARACAIARLFLAAALRGAAFK